MRKFLILSALVAGIFLLTSSKPDKVYYNEKYRPQYHFTPERNFMGDPCGLVYLDGKYHLFYQQNPKGTEAGHSHWGHAVSTDLIRWEHHPVALFPDNLSEDSLFCTALPGSAIVDHRNSLGVEKGGQKTIVLFYTSAQCGQRIAYSTDGGNSWQKYTGNPVIPYDENDKARHPKVFWHEATSKWVMVLYRIPENEERKQGFSFYTSSNLTEWEFQSHLAGFRDKPDMFELRVNNRPDETRWIVMEGNGDYVIGTFNGTSFTPESIRLKSDFGRNYYGAITCGNLSEKEGRILQVARVKNEEWPGMPFHGQLTFPAELSLKKINTGVFLTRQPIKEIEELYDKRYSWKEETLIPGIGQNLVKKVQGDCLRIKGRFDLKNCESFGFMLRTGKKNQGTEVVYNVKRGTLTILGMTLPLEPVDNKIHLDILLDRASAEVFANNGRGVLTNVFFNEESDNEFILFNTGGELLVEELDIYSLTSSWFEED